MIKLFTQNSLQNEWSDDRQENINRDNAFETSSYSPSEETISFLKSFARSFIVDLSKDSNYTMPMA
ncbi:MAG: hypothetical protein MJZ14_06745 [Paludibacteraceae bacterium]|nr:hypothetical protein [Paludibacteraceae bacterium]